MPIGGFGVGLYFDDKRVYMAELRTEFGATQILRSAVEEIGPAGGPEELSAAVRRAIQKSGIRAKTVNVALPEQESMVRYFEIALLPRRERAGAVRYEAQKYVPFEAKDLYCDFLSYPDNNARKMRVLFLAAKKKPADEALEAVKRAGLKTRAVETYSLAYVRALQSAQTTKGVGAIIDIGGDGVMQILMTQDRLILMSRRSSVPPSSAGVNFDAIISELRLSLNYFSKTFKTLKIEQLTLCADLEKEFRGLGTVVQQEFGLPVRSLNPLSLYGKGLSYSPGLLAAAGMSLWNAQNGSDRMNLLSAEKIRVADVGAPSLPPLEERELLQKWVIGATVSAAAFVFCVHLFMAGQVKASRSVSSGQSRKSEYSSLKPDQIQQKIQDAARRSDFLDKLLRKRHFYTEKMNEVARTMPGEIRLTVLDYSDNETSKGESILSLRLEGYVESQGAGNELSALNKLVTALTDNAEFMRGVDEVRIASAQKLVVEGVPTLKFAIDVSSREKRG